ncbi:alcohol dehydrogenase catalytic domain-containing protein [Actinotalea solisilvae]|uniref:alcohol dehydrogenase catalytic domain-containing protein n=1 Tax=Actinotalea solisilvae TaxID=2072922 RepID=UPI001F2A2212|nr:alcohol dehydrogenase catalytic domain-containing protein [Actinotalea solisilvae]
MRAVVFERSGGPLVVRDVREPACPMSGAVIRVEATGVCRSDWHGWQGHDDGIALPHVPGHELAGTVVAVGPAVRAWRVGDRVTVPFVCACGECAACLAGEHQVCERQTQPGFTHWGSFAERVAIDHADVNLVRLPDGMSAVTAASLGCRFATAYRAVEVHGRVRPGQWVAVHGCGGVGLSAVMIAVAAGARVVALDVSAAARAAALDLGAEVALDPAEVAGSRPASRAEVAGPSVSTPAEVAGPSVTTPAEVAGPSVSTPAEVAGPSADDDVPAPRARRSRHRDDARDRAAAVGARVAEVTGGGAHVSLDALGDPVAAAASVLGLRRRGRHVQVGLLLVGDAWSALPMDRVVAWELELYGSHGMAAHEYASMLARVASGVLTPDRLVARTIGLDDAGAALAEMGRGALGPGMTVVVP